MGFVCPVHTPDGAPCGLLNHISLGCIPLPCDPTGFNSDDFIKTMIELGMISRDVKSDTELLPILLDGRHIGNIQSQLSENFVNKIRHLKIN